MEVTNRVMREVCSAAGVTFPDEVPVIGFDEAMDFYYVHGYYVPFDGAAKDHAAATCEYGKTFVAAVEKDNIRATQFHPEKSQLAGMKLLETFLAGAGACQSTD